MHVMTSKDGPALLFGAAVTRVHGHVTAGSVPSRRPLALSDWTSALWADGPAAALARHIPALCPDHSIALPCWKAVTVLAELKPDVVHLFEAIPFNWFPPPHTTHPEQPSRALSLPPFVLPFAARPSLACPQLC